VIIAYKNNQPKNIFEEIYNAEMHAAETRQQTPLSNTEYFHAVPANNRNDSIGKRSKVSVKESPKDNSPFTIEANRTRDVKRRSLWNADVLTVKNVTVKSKFEYHGVDIELDYFYLLSRDGKTPENPEGIHTEHKLSIAYSGSVAGEKLQEFEEFAAFGITPLGLRARIEENLAGIHNYWVDNYSHSRFKHGEVEDYKIGGKTRFYLTVRE
jgi:hypothetical protein